MRNALLILFLKRLADIRMHRKSSLYTHALKYLYLSSSDTNSSSSVDRNICMRKMYELRQEPEAELHQLEA